MDTRAHPGKGLSLPQLVFALNAELKDMAYSPSQFGTPRDERRATDRPSLNFDQVRDSRLNIEDSSGTLKMIFSSFLTLQKISRLLRQPSTSGGTC